MCRTFALRLALLASTTIGAGACGAGAQALVAGFRSAHPDCSSGHVFFSERAAMPGVFDAESCGVEDTGFRAQGSHGYRFNFGADAIRRASFESGCPADQLSIVVLSASQVGVVGCERRVVYMSTESGWALNSAPDE